MAKGIGCKNCIHDNGTEKGKPVLVFCRTRNL